MFDCAKTDVAIKSQVIHAYRAARIITATLVQSTLD